MNHLQLQSIINKQNELIELQRLSLDRADEQINQIRIIMEQKDKIIKLLEEEVKMLMVKL